MDWMSHVPEAYVDVIRHKRTRLWPEKVGIRGFRELVRCNFEAVELNIEEHTHPDAIELCYFSKGAQIYCASGRNWRVSSGMAFIAYANELHSSGSYQQEKGSQLYYMIIDTCNDTEHFFGLTGEDARRLAQSLNQLQRCFYVGARFKARLEEMIDLYIRKPPMYELMLRCQACLMVNDLVRASDKVAPALTSDIYAALSYIEDHLTGPQPDIAELAKFVHLSESHFKDKFKKQTGWPPMAYQRKRRIDLAQDMLLGGASVTQTAMDLGFASSQHFTTTFKRYLSRTPGQFKRGRSD